VTPSSHPDHPPSSPTSSASTVWTLTSTPTVIGRGRQRQVSSSSISCLATWTPRFVVLTYHGREHRSVTTARVRQQRWFVTTVSGRRQLRFRTTARDRRQVVDVRSATLVSDDTWWTLGRRFWSVTRGTVTVSQRRHRSAAARDVRTDDGSLTCG